MEVMKRTLGIMVFEALCPEFNFTDELIHEICGIFETNAIEIRLAQSEVNGIYEIGSLMEHNCVPNICMTFDSNLNVSETSGLLQPGLSMTLSISVDCQGWQGHIKG